MLGELMRQTFVERKELAVVRHPVTGGGCCPSLVTGVGRGGAALVGAASLAHLPHPL